MIKTIFKSILLMLSVGLTSVNVMGQTLKDFYIPSQSNYNKASFYSPSQTGERTESTRVIYYINNGDETWDIVDANMFQGKPTAIVTQTVKISTTEVKMIKSVSTGLFETNKKRNYEPSRILLKMPPTGQSLTWTILGEGGDKPTKYTSSWTTVIVEGVSKKAIKVVSQYTDWKAKTISYYAQGIGLMKTDFIDEDGTVIPFEKFDGLSYEEIKR